MKIQLEILERLYQDFIDFLAARGEMFHSFATSQFIVEEENYKYELYRQAKESLEQGRWKQTDIGTGKIQQRVKEAIKTNVVYNYKRYNNNLVDWRKRDDFSKLEVSSGLEAALFDFYKNRTQDKEIFELLLGLGLSYQLIAYLFFIKDKNQYLPITQERFDEVFDLIEIPEFKTSGNASWTNYSEYIDIIRQVKNFLKEKDKNVTLLDAHSFLYILGSQMRLSGFRFTSSPPSKSSGIETSSEESQQEQLALDEKETELKTEFRDDKLPEEFSDDLLEAIFEGAKKTVTINKFERDPRARELCIEHWKAICAVCNFDFEKTYGDLGSGFIHVHHLTPMWQIGKTYQIDPINDLRPVCPNCHAMLHRREQPLTIEQLKTVVEANSIRGTKISI